MPQISGYVPGPYQGVSQAPPQVRLSGTCQAMEDCLPVIPMGVGPRPPLSYLAQLLATGALPSAFYKDIPTSTDGILELLINREGASNVPRLFTPAGVVVPLTVTAAAQTYLDTTVTSPDSGFAIRTIEDNTFVTNRLKPVADVATLSTARPFEALIWVRTGNYGRSYKVTLTDGTHTQLAIYNVNTGGAAADSLGVGCDAIANGLYNSTIRGGSGATVVGTAPAGGLINLGAFGYTVTLIGSLIYISHPTVDFTLKVEDDSGGSSMRAIKTEVQRFSDLPDLAVPGFVCKINQEAGGADSNYWVSFAGTSATNRGVWNECLSPGTVLGLDPLTMPLVLKKLAGTWTIDTGSWAQRQVGDPIQAPDPAFVGDTINDIVWFKGRLALLYDGGLTLSASDDPFKFYRTTCATDLASDPIGLLNPANERSAFKQAVAFDEGRLVLLSDKVQALLAADREVAPGKIGLDTLTDAPYDSTFPALATNHRVYFGAAGTVGMEVSEIAVDRLSGNDVDEPVTTALPSYLPAGLNRGAAVRKAFLSLYGTSGGTALYIHLNRYSEQQRVQNSVSRWNLPAGFTLVGYYWTRYVCHMVLAFNGRLIKFTIDISPDRSDFLNYGLIYLDLRVPGGTCSYDAASDTTTFTGLPADFAPTKAALVAPTTVPVAPFGYLPEVVSVASTTVVLKGNWTASPASIVFGRPYTASLTPTTIYKVGQDNRPEHSGDLTLDHLKADFAAFSSVLVTTSKGVRTVYDGPLATYGALAPGIAVPIEKAQARVRVPLGDSNVNTVITFQSYNHLGWQLMGFEWLAEFGPTARRVT